MRRFPGPALIHRVNELEAKGVEVYHGVASYDNRHDDINSDSAKPWGRTRENVAYLSSFFLDIDVADDKPAKAYATLEQAEEGLARFVEVFGMPYSYLVHSGSGLHVYWFLDVDVPRDKWRCIALKFKDAVKVAGLLADPARTADAASLLRPVGATNRKAKYGAAGRPVEGKWCRFGKVNLEAFEAACVRLIGDRPGMGHKATSNATGATLTGVEPTQAPHWFDGLADEVQVRVLRSLLTKLPARSVSDYGDWLAVGAALAGIEELPRDVLFNLWAEWSQSTDDGAESWQEESIDEQRRRWDGLNRSGVGALILRAKAAGWRPEALNDGPDGDAARVAVVEAQESTRERWTLAEAESYMQEHVIYVSADNIYLLDELQLGKDALDIRLARRMPITKQRITASGLLKEGSGSIVDYMGSLMGEANECVRNLPRRRMQRLCAWTKRISKYLRIGSVESMRTVRLTMNLGKIVLKRSGQASEYSLSTMLCSKNI